ncbi:MAG: hypothetical protein ABI426_11255 [Flavobacterium sp.]
MKTPEEIIISKNKKPFWQLVLASILYTCSIYVFYLVFHYWSIRWIAVGNRFLELGLLLILGAVIFSTIRTIILDVKSKSLKIEFSIGTLKFDAERITDLKYISVFRNTSSEEHEVNLWYKKNKHLGIDSFEKFEQAFECGKKFSDKLNLDLLDATVKGDSKWIEK